MKLAATMVIRDDAFYVDMALKSILPYVDGIYIQDQGSTDGTVAVIEEVMPLFPGKIVLEIVPTGLPRFDPGYNEPEFRNKALDRTIELFDPDFVCKFDADEVATPLLFEKIEEIEKKETSGEFPSQINALCCSEGRFISRNLISADREAYGFERDGNWYYGGHIWFWRKSLNIRYTRNPAFTTYFHCILNPDPVPYLWIPGICHIHLHRTFGPKAFDFWAEKGDVFERVNPFNAREMAPIWFHHNINLGTAEKVEFAWPDYVLQKWEAWGIWD